MDSVPFESPVLQLAVLAVSSSLSPGPNNLLLATCASMFGAWRTMPTVLGMYLGFGLMLIVTALGLAEVLLRWPGVLTTLRWGAAGYLSWLSVKLLRAQWSTSSRTAAPPGVLRAGALQFVNPKLWLMSLSTVSLSTPTNHALPSLLLVTCFVLMTLPSMLAYLYVGGVLHRLGQNSQTRRMLNILLAAMTAVSALLMLVPSF